MNAKTVGLSEVDSRLYFINNRIVIMKDPESGIPTIVKRQPGPPTDEDWNEINKALALCSMELSGDGLHRKDGLWCHLAKEARNGRRKECNDPQSG